MAVAFKQLNEVTLLSNVPQALRDVALGQLQVLLHQFAVHSGATDL
jgi:hypothetical protein